jgi:hypothetical protein
MTSSETPPTDITPRGKFLAATWKGLNSALLITLISALTAALLTHWFADRQADSADMAARRAELSRDLVELELRTARLNVIAAQGADRKAFTTAEMTRIGERAKAIVSADSQTVTSDPSFKDVHLVTVLGRAETAAGVDLSDKGFLLDFTDRDPGAAVALTPNILCRTNLLVSYLKSHFQSGAFPLPLGDTKGRSYESSVYGLFDSPKFCAIQAAGTPGKSG